LVALENLHAERPSAPRRVKQVLEAAEKCFRINGFHATSMAQIAATAQMSVGHIYRYFPCKDDIIAAIVERDVAAAMADFDAVEDDEAGVFPAFFEHWRSKVERMSERGCSVLWLEIMSEAARNPRAARVMGEFRASVAKRLCALFQAGAPGRWSDEEVAEKVDLLLLLTDAVAFKAISQPHYDPRRTADTFVGYAHCIFEQD
jgi:AcrR family transcriptional regulator